MKNYWFNTCFFCLLLSVGSLCKAQKNIVISDSLSANAEMLKVKMGVQWGKIWKMHFGDYAVVSGKSGWTTSSTKGNFFNTKTEDKSTQKFSFILVNKTPDSARVNAANNIQVQSLHEMELFPHFSWGSNELVQASHNFSAFININSDTSQAWGLFMNVTNARDAEGSYEAFLTNGERKVFIIPASADKNGNERTSSSAMGYELKENGKPIGAVQYFGGGMLGMNKNIVWIHNQLDPTFKLILAAAITALLQIKVTAPGF